MSPHSGATWRKDLGGIATGSRLDFLLHTPAALELAQEKHLAALETLVLICKDGAAGPYAFHTRTARIYRRTQARDPSPVASRELDELRTSAGITVEAESFLRLAEDVLASQTERIISLGGETASLVLPISQGASD